MALYTPSSFFKRFVFSPWALLVLFAICSGCSSEKESTQPAPITNQICKDGTLKFGEECVSKETIQFMMEKDFIKLDGFKEDRALTKEEIRNRIGPIFDKYIAKSNSENIRFVFEQKVFKRTKALDARSLRLLLDIRFYHDNFSRIVYASFSEGLRDMIIPFIEEKPSLVIAIVKDEAQLNRKLLSDAFYQFIDQMAVDKKTKEIIDDRFTVEYRELMTILKNVDV